MMSRRYRGAKSIAYITRDYYIFISSFMTVMLSPQWPTDVRYGVRVSHGAACFQLTQGVSY